MNTQHYKSRIERFDFLSLRDFSLPLDPEEDILEEAVTAEPAPPPPPPPPVYSQADLERACAAAREEGRRQGVEEGKQTADAEQARTQEQLLHTLSATQASLMKTQAELQDHYASKQHEVLSLAMAIAAKIASGALQENADQAILSLVEQTLPLLLRQPKITLMVHPALRSEVETKMLRLALEAGFEGNMHVGEHASLALGDCRMEWQDGRVERSASDLWKEILELLNPKDEKPADQPPPSASGEQEAHQGEANATATPPAPCVPEEVYHFISHTLETIEASMPHIHNPENPKE